MGGVALATPAVPRLWRTWRAQARRVRTWAEVATLLRTWEACMRWQDIKQKRPALKPGEALLKVVDRQVAAGHCEYKVRRGEVEEWVRDTDITELYAVRAYEEQQAAALLEQREAARRARDEALERERQRRLKEMRRLQVQSPVGARAPHRLTLFGQPLGSLSHVCAADSAPRSLGSPI